MELKAEKITKDLDGAIGIVAIAIAFFLPVNQKIVVPLIALMTVLTIISWIKNGIQLPEKKYWFFPLLFFMYLVGLLFTTNFDYGGSDIETRMSFLLFPLLFGTTKRKTPFPIRKIILALTVGCLATIGLCYYHANQCFNEFGYVECYEGVRLAFNMHPTYMAIYMILAFTFLCIAYLKSTIGSGWKIGVILITGVLLFMVYRLYSLGPWIGFFGMLVMLGLAIAIYRKKIKLAVLTLLGTIVLAVIAVQNFSFLKADYLTVTSSIQSYWDNPKAYMDEHKEYVNSVDSRMIIWLTSLKFITEHPMGVGTGDMRDELLNYYRKNGMDVYAERELNPHCQYLQTTIAIGIFPALFLIFSLGYYFWLGLKHRSFYLMALIVLFAVTSLFESVLERQWGIVFFMFFLSLFLCDLPTLQRNSKNGKVTP